MQWLPNDLIRAHNIIHQYCGSAKFHAKVKNSELEDPFWLPHFIRSLDVYGIDKASRDCFVNFMRQIAAILSTAFAVNTTRGGWKDICPPDTYQILNKCEKFESELFSDDDRAMMVGSINDVLIPISSMTGMISDNEIIETIGDKIIGHTHKFELH